MARIHSISGPRISALPDARPTSNKAYVKAMGDRGFGADTRERGDFVSIRMDQAFLKEDVLQERVLWIPFADADCVYDRDLKRFTVIGGPRPKNAQWFLDNLEPHEHDDLFRDLKWE